MTAEKDDKSCDLTALVASALDGERGFLQGLQSRGPYACMRCATPIGLPGICDACGEAERGKEARARIQKGLSTIPDRWQWASFADQQSLLVKGKCPPEAIRLARHALRKLICREDWLVVLAGESGKGKTSLASAMLRHVIERGSGRSALFVYAPRIARAYRNTRLGETPQIIDACENTWLLCIDDLGADAVYRDTLREVIQVREADQKPTIITTFLSEQDVLEAYGGGISRRMYRDGSIVWVGSKPAPAGGDGEQGSGLEPVAVPPPGTAKAASIPPTGQTSSQVIPIRSRGNLGSGTEGV
jgi:hypothetical protein